MLVAREGYYRVYRDGQEFSQHTTERKCVESAYQCKADYPCARVTYKHDYEVEVAKVPRAQTFLGDAAGDGYCYTRPPDDGEGPTAPTLSGAADDDDAVLNWSGAIDALSGILDYQIERSAVSPESFSLLTTVEGTETSYTDTIGNNTSWKYRVRGRDTAPTPNNGTYSNTVTVTTPPSSSQLQPGTLSIEDASYSAAEGGQITFRVRRSGNGSASPTVTVNYAFTGLGSAAPASPTGTLTWVGTANGLRTVTVTLGSVSSTTVGAVTLSNPQAASGAIAPTLGVSSVSVTVQDIPAGGYSAPGIPSIVDDAISTIASDGTANFTGPAPTIFVFDDFRNGADGTSINLNGAVYGSWAGYNTGTPQYDTDVRHSGTAAMKGKVQSESKQRGLRLNYTPTDEFFLSFYMRHTVGPTGIRIGGAKITWIFDGDNGTQSGQGYDMCWPTRTGVSSTAISIAGNDFNQSGGFNNMWVANEWCRFSAWAKDNGASPMNFYLQAISQTTGFQKRTAPTLVSTMFNNSSSDSVNRLTIPGYYDDDDLTFEAWYDDIYYASNPARVEIGDNPIYEQCRELSICPITAMSSTSISARMMRGGHGTMQNKYVFVHDSSNQLVTFNGSQGRLIS